MTRKQNLKHIFLEKDKIEDILLYAVQNQYFIFFFERAKFGVFLFLFCNINID